MAQQVSPATGYGRYVWPRDGRTQQEVTDWEITHTPLQPDGQRPDTTALEQATWRPVSTPGAMVQWESFAAGEAGHPYVGTNSAEYRWTSEATWWLRTRISADQLDTGAARAELVFDGVDYDAWVWVDGEDAGEHHGMFGGPVLDVSAWLGGQAGEHEVLVALRPAGLEQGKPGWGSSGRLVKADTFCRWINNPDLMTTGIWQPVRLVHTPAYRLDRPHVTTTPEPDGSYRVSVEVEVLRSDVSPDVTFLQRHGQAPPVYDPRHSGHDEQAEVTVSVTDPDGAPVASGRTTVQVAPGRVWAHLEAQIDDARPWWPAGIGEDTQPLYTVRLGLTGPDGAQDHLDVRTGLRSITWQRSGAPRSDDHWFNWTLEVNGQPTQIRGINWMPMDLLRFERPRYEHLLRLIKDAGMHLVRVWGGGLIETEDFYDLCDELGLLVWQDFPLNVHYDASGIPLQHWEQQVLWSVERLRNRASLALWCGGNEFDPYAHENAAVVGIAERIIADADGQRAFMRSCSDPGDVHPYLEADTTWYHRLYRDVPAITEWGGHTLPTTATLAEILPPEELQRPLDTLLSPDEKAFATSHPSLHRHWAEFNPDRIPRMLSRTRIFEDLAGASFAEAVQTIQLGAAEIYHSVIADFSAGDAAQTVLMPWVYNRPWPSVGMQAVDHSGRPTAGYYAIKRGFTPGGFVLRPEQEALAPGESLQVGLGLTAGRAERGYEFTVYDQALRVRHQQTGTIRFDQFDQVSVPLPAGEVGSVFLVITDPQDPQVQQVRVVRVAPTLADDDVRAAYRATAQPTAHFMDTSLRAHVAGATTQVQASVTDTGTEGTARELSVHLVNQGERPAAYVTLEGNDPRWLVIGEDSGFWIAPGATRTVTVRARPAAEVSTIVTEVDTAMRPAAELVAVQGWNL